MVIQLILRMEIYCHLNTWLISLSSISNNPTSFYWFNLSLFKKRNIYIHQASVKYNYSLYLHTSIYLTFFAHFFLNSSFFKTSQFKIAKAYIYTDIVYRPLPLHIIWSITGSLLLVVEDFDWGPFRKYALTHPPLPFDSLIPSIQISAYPLWIFQLHI